MATTRNNRSSEAYQQLAILSKPLQCLGTALRRQRPGVRIPSGAPSNPLKNLFLSI